MWRNVVAQEKKNLEIMEQILKQLAAANEQLEKMNATLEKMIHK